MILLLVGFFIWLLLLALLRLCAPLLERWLGQLHPNESSLLLLVILTLPLLAATLITLELASPAWSHWFIASHCHELRQSLACGQHAPITPHIPVLLAIASVLAAGLVVWLLYRLWRAQKTLTTFIALADAHEIRDVYILPSDAPLAFTLGYWRSRIFLSQGLLEVCDENSIRSVIEHERAHQLRHDNLRLFVAKLATLPFCWGVGRLLERLDLTHEQACDWYATGTLEAHEVAASIVQIARLNRDFADAKNLYSASFFCRSHVRERVNALIKNDYPQDAGWRRALITGGSTLMAITLLLDPLHHWIEWFY
ncbi:M56 family metallopeptidase [uncultured Gilvimarinus sp.]|uniref:M56 family metallopeptidase n=1 Tax=uncultured Gilvimarinus sp. TaxID=1689143 RepID=UPI0030DBCBC4